MDPTRGSSDVNPLRLPRPIVGERPAPTTPIPKRSPKTPAGKKRPPPGQTPSPSLFFDLKLEKKGDKEAVNAFAQALTGASDLTDHVIYTVTEIDGAFRCSLRIPAWSNEAFEGEVQPSRKEAEQSAAHAFKMDWRVVQHAKNFPKGRKRLENDEFKERIRQERRLAREASMAKHARSR
ncbi:unnamed protein product [Symbiodinium sp. CCMP2592]|nr:unnamed protein product [Symbiodinium sp. CCMP2592]